MSLWQKFLFILGIFLILLGGYFTKPLFCKVRKDIVDSGSLYCLINRIRYRKGLKLFKVNPQLEEAARLRAYDIITHNQFSHESISGRMMGEATNKAGYQFKGLGENLARGFENNDQVFDAWMKSASHSANILNENFKEIGVAILEGYQGSYGQATIIVVGIFGLAL